MICPTPGCGYRLEPLHGKSAQDFPCSFECPSCASLYVYQLAGIDEGGPHGDRLVLVYDVPPGR